MIQFVVSIQINRLSEQVFDYVADESNLAAPLLSRGIKSGVQANFATLKQLLEA